MKHLVVLFIVLTSIFAAIFTAVFVKYLRYEKPVQSQSESGDNFMNEKPTGLVGEPVEQKVSVSAWIPWWEENDALSSFEKAGDTLETILPVWYAIDMEGKLEPTNSKLREDILKASQKLGINVTPTINNAYENGFDSERISLLLNNDSLQESLISKLIEDAEAYNFSGWDLDWEQVKVEDRDAYSSFVRKASDALSEKDLTLSVTVHAQSGSPTDWVGAMGQDLEMIGQSADYVRVMIYDFHHATSTSGPITPVKDLVNTLEYVTTVIPLNKLIVGLPTYGYDWIGKEGTAMQYSKMVNYVENNGGKFTRDPKNYSLNAEFNINGEEHSVWLEDSVALIEKIKICLDYGVNQFTLWHLGGEDPKIWSLI